MLLTHNLARPRMPSGTPVFRRINLLESVQLPNRLQASVNQLPSAGPILVNLAMFRSRSPARPVEHPFRAASNGANPAEICEHALPAAKALLGPDRLLFKQSHELSVERSVDRFARESLGYCLNTRAAAKRDNGLISLDGLSQFLNELILALPFNRDLLDLHRIAVKLTRHAHGVAGDPDFPLSSREAHGDTRAATNK